MSDDVRHMSPVGRAGRTLGLAVAGLFVLLALLHAPWVQVRVGQWALGRLALVGISARADSISYNLLTLRVRAEGLSLSTTGSLPQPFVRVRSVEVTLPRSVFTSGLSIDSLQIDDARVTLVRGKDGSTNWPGTPGAKASGSTNRLSSLPIRRVAIRHAAVTWRDDALDASIDVDAVDLILDPAIHGAVGRLTMASPGRARWQAHETSIAAEAALAWDGVRLAIESARLASPEVELNVHGTVDVLATNPQIAIDCEGDVDLTAAAAWLSLEPRPTGTLTVEGRVRGPAGGPHVGVGVRGSDLGWRGVAGVSIDAVLQADGRGIVADRVDLHAVGGTLAAQGRIEFGISRAGAFTVDWRDLDGGRLFEVLSLGRSVPLDAVLEGRAAVSWTTWRPEAVTASADLAMRATQTDTRRVGLNGAVSFTAGLGNWQARIQQGIDGAVNLQGAIGGRVSDATLGASTVSGQVTLVAEAAPRLWRLMQKLDVAPDKAPGALDGRARAEFVLAGSVGDPSTEVRLTIADWRQGPVGPVSVDGQFALSTREAIVRDVEARIGRNTLRGSGAVVFDDGRLSGRIDADLPALSEIVPGLSTVLRPSGVAAVSASISGRVGTPIVDGHVSGRALSVAGQHIERLAGVFHLDRQTIDIAQLELTQPDGVLALGGLYDFRTRALAGRIAARNVTVGPVTGEADEAALAPMSARLDGDISVSGSLDHAVGEGRIELRDTVWADRRIGHVVGALTLAGRRLEAAIEVPDLFTTGTAAVELDAAGAFVVEARMIDADLAALASRLAFKPDTPVAGAASLTARLDGRLDRWQQSRVRVDLQRLDATVGGVPVQATHAVRASYDEHGLEIGDLVLDIGRSQLRVSGQLGREGAGGLTASLDGALGDVVHVASTAVGPDGLIATAETDGHVSVTVGATGSIEHPDIQATVALDQGRLAVGDYPPATGLTLRGSYDAGLLKLSQLTGSWQAATFSASGQMPLVLFAAELPNTIARAIPSVAGVGHLDARFESLSAAMLAPWLSPSTLEQLAGTLSGTLMLDVTTASMAGLRGSLALDRAEVSIAGVRFDQWRPTRVELADGLLRVVDWEWGGEGNRLSLGGSVRLEGQPRFDLSAGGELDLRAVGAFLTGISTGGQGVVSARLTGTSVEPQLDGRIDLHRGEIRTADGGFVVSELSGSLLLGRDEFTVADVYGNANGGTLSIAGRIQAPGLRPTGGRLAITGRGMAMVLPDPLKTEVDADLSLGFDDGHLSLSGDVTVLRGAYREPLSLAGGLLQALQQSEPLMLPEASSAIDLMTLDVRLTTAEDIVVDNNYAQLAVGADLRVQGTVAQPVLLGRAEAREGGRIFLGGHAYQLVGGGAIDFANPSRIEPDLSITAVTRVAGYDVTLVLKGPPTRLETTLKADGLKPLGQSDIVSLLVTGRVQADGRGAPSIGRDQLLTYLSGEFLGVAGRAVGLDTLRIEQGSDVRFDAGLIATETNPGSRLTFGKQMTRDVEMVFSQDLARSGTYTWIIGYRPRHNVELRIVSDDNNDRLYDFRHDVTIGGARATAASPGAAKPRVGAIRFTGEPGEAEGELRRQLALTGGKPFDFFRWQRDRERIERFFRERGRLEARVVARRSEVAGAAAPLVDLEYEIHPGPRTIVDLLGAPVSSRLRKAIEDVWIRAVFETFLVADATRTARAALVRDGYLRGTVAASIDVRESVDEKHLILTIVRGPRSSRRRMVFSGNQHVGSARLAELVRARGLDQTAWLDPAPLKQTLAALYRDEGFLSAAVVVAPPVFEGSAATLTVTIDEGPSFRIASIDFEGAGTQPVDELRQAFGLRPGAVVSRAAIASAVQALGDHYRERGFGNVRVVLGSHPSPEAETVALTVTVDEGARQVLRDVVVEGIRRTSPAVVSRELRLKIGDPVDPAAWSRVRRRLYDTGVFRQVDVEAVPIAAGPDAGQPSAEQPMRARVGLEEWPPLRLRYGFELSDEQKPAADHRTLQPGVASDLTYRNLFGRAASTGVAARYTKDFRATRGYLTTPAFFGLPLTSNLFLARSREKTGESIGQPIIVDRSDFTAEQRFRVRGRFQIAYSYNFERNHTFAVNAKPDDPLAYDVTTNVARLTATGLFDSRDDLVDATRGLFFTSTFEYGVAALGSDLRFAKQFVEQTYYRTLGRRVVFATAARLGLGAGYGQDLIPSERFFAGGGNSVRGYAEDSLGPRVFGDAAGGNAELVLNEELRFPVFWRLRGVAFVDAGNVFATIGDFALTGLRTSVGGGLRLQTPFALVRVDLGAPINRRAGESRARWFFSIGQMF